MTTFLNRFFAVASLVFLITNASAQVATNNLLPGGIPPGAVRALPAAKPAEPAAGSLSKSNIVGLGVSRAMEKAIQPAEGGARADFGLQKTFFPVDVKDGGPVVITAPDGRRLSFRATFLALHDLATDQSLLIAEVTNRVGAIVGKAEVIYTNAFDTLRADIRYRYTAQSLEQDIILHEPPTIPKEFSAANTRLEVWTEWYNSDPVQKTIQTIDLRAKETSGLLPASMIEDEGLDFGTMKIVTGHAFSSTTQDEQTPVGKAWVQIEGRNWLVETVDYLAVKANLDLLPKSRGSASLSRPKSEREGLVRSLAQLSKPAAKTAAKMVIAQARQTRQAEFVMDFVIVSSVPAPSGIVSWWPAAAGVTATDTITNNHGTLQYGAVSGIGKVGQSFIFDGTSAHVKIPDHASLHFSNALTIEAWIYPESTSDYHSIVDKWDAVLSTRPSQMSYDLSLLDGGQVYILVGADGTPYNTTYVLSSNAVPANQWTHVAGTYDGNNLRVYLNGVLDGEGVYSAGIFPGTNAMAIGGVIGGVTDSTVVSPFSGRIDEPSLYARALGSSEILGIYNAGAAGKHNPKCVSAPTDIVAWWPGDGNGYDLGRTNFATVSGVTYGSAVVGQGFSFNGTSSSVIAAGDPALNLGANDDITIEAWIAPLPNATTYDVMSIAGKRYAPNDNIATGYELFLDDGALGFQIGSGSTRVNFIATNNLLNSGYHHVAVTMDRDAADGGHLYVDGVSVWTFQPASLSGSLSNAEPFRIGIHPTSGFNGWYKGVIDEVTVYRRALTNSEVTALYAAGSAGKCKVDTDADGLTDLQEDFLDTDPNNPDSDNDGLQDGNEVFAYHTNPNNADEDSDGMNDGWEILHFGNLSQPAYGEDGDYDADGATNLEEFLNGTDPNTLSFSTHYANLYVSNRVVNGRVEIHGGFPHQMAVLVDSTNLVTATWTTYVSNFSATLPNSDGNHTVFVALRGLSTNFAPYWDETELTLDRVPPVVVFTNPAVANATVIKPYLQLQGYANEPLVKLAYDLTNAAGLFTDEMAGVVDQYFDTNAFDFTTNYFQAYDVELTNGLNTITLTVSDRAGNVTVTNLAVTLDYTSATNPPTMQLLWPTNGMHVSGDSFYIRGLINDETAQMVAQIVDTNGVTNEITGIVERNGMFWVEALPLAAGTNELTLFATNAAGYVSSTNLSVVKSSVALIITSTPTGESLYIPQGTVNGTVSDTNYSVTVNGMAATVYEDGSWMAENVPVIGRGTATFDALAGPAGSSGTPPTATSVEVEMPAFVALVKHIASLNGEVHTEDLVSNNSRGKSYSSEFKAENGAWRQRYKADASDFLSYSTAAGSYNTLTTYAWSDSNPVGTYHTVTSSGAENSGDMYDDQWMVRYVPDASLDHSSSEASYTTYYFVHHFFAKGVRHQWDLGNGYAEQTASARTRLVLFTGGKARMRNQSIFSLNAWALEYGKAWQHYWFFTPRSNVAFPSISLLGKPLGNDGNLWAPLPNNQQMDLGLKVDGAKHVTAGAIAAKFTPYIAANGVRLSPDKINTTNCVGQKIVFSLGFDPSWPSGVETATYDWVLSAKFVNEQWQRFRVYSQDPLPPEIVYYGSINYRLNQDLLKSASPFAWWVSDGNKNASLNVTLSFVNGQSVRLRVGGKFSMYRPSVAMVNSTLHGTPQNMWLTGPPPWTGLEFGSIGLGHAGGPNNMSFTVRITSSDFAGEAKITQLCTIDATHYPLDINISNQLDNSDPYEGAYNPNIYKNSNPQGNINIVPLDDSPANAGFGSFHFYGSFVDYIMFSPGGAEDIYVTLGKVTWGTSFGASYPSATISPNSVNGPTGPDDSDSFPDWTDVWSNPN